MSEPIPTLATHMTQSEASEMRCPLGRTFQDPITKCLGGACPLWRWHPRPASHPGYMAAVKREEGFFRELDRVKITRGDDGAKIRSDTHYHQRAVAKIAAEPWMNMIPSDDDRGFCGLGGKP